MSQDNEFLYDEDDSVAFIQNYLPQDLKEKFSKDDIIYIVDLIYNYYESKGYLTEEEDEEDEEIDNDVEIDEEELLDYVVKNAMKDGIGKFEAEEIKQIVHGELEYCDSINLFDE
ncbi:hypothetical protein [Parabacteroides sp. Marseille-P3160]|uniref:hypothetical protein n=1 Tax=Parabacteroides sp. Marseille-P3160 TaxID=1917887 RepID=UPI0009BB5477|nr:hypothetical protein [Parabacteroides sp. Marseille-P3160]